MGFYVQDDYWEAIEELPKKQQDEILGALVRLFFTGDENPGLKSASKAVFVALRERVKAASKKSSTWKSKRGSSEDEPRVQTEVQTEVSTEDEPPVNPGMNRGSKSDFLNKRERESKKDKPYGLSKNPPIPPLSVAEDDAEFGAEALAEFNRITGQTVQSLSPSVWSSLARIRQSGRTMADVTAVVQSKLEEWGDDPKMAQYIRPSTLFGQRFEEYLGAATAAQERKGRRANRFAEYD